MRAMTTTGASSAGRRTIQHERAYTALSILLVMVVLASFTGLGMFKAAMLASGAILLTRCCTAAQARRSVEWKIIQPLTDGFRFAEGLPLFKNRIRTVPEAAPGLKAIAKDGLAWLDGQMAGRDSIVPKRFTLADVALYAFLEFGATVGQGIDPALTNLAAWFERTKGRPSAKA